MPAVRFTLVPVSLEAEIVAGPPLPLSPELWLLAGGFCSIFLVGVCLSCLILQHHFCPGTLLV